MDGHRVGVVAFKNSTWSAIKLMKNITKIEMHTFHRNRSLIPQKAEFDKATVGEIIT